MGEHPLWVGLDVSELTAAICVYGIEAQPQLELTVGSTASEIADALSSFPIESLVEIVLESGAEQGLARSLKALGYPITLLDAGKAQKFLSIRSNKTDRNDARGLADIARLGRSHSLSAWVRSSEFELIRSELVIRDHLVRQRTAVRCCLRSMVRREGSRLKGIAYGKHFRSTVEAELSSLATQNSYFDSTCIRSLLEVSEKIDEFVSAADKRISVFAKSNTVTRRFIGLPGVGPVCAVSFYSVIEDPDRFVDTNAVGAYLGMVPKFKQSGTAVHRTPISRAGNTLTRGHLYMSAGVLLSRAAQRSAIGDWGKALAARRGYKLARMAVARKLALAMLSIWKRGCEFEPYPLEASRRGEAGSISVPKGRALSL